MNHACLYLSTIEHSRPLASTNILLGDKGITKASGKVERLHNNP